MVKVRIGRRAASLARVFADLRSDFAIWGSLLDMTLSEEETTTRKCWNCNYMHARNCHVRKREVWPSKELSIHRYRFKLTFLCSVTLSRVEAAFIALSVVAYHKWNKRRRYSACHYFRVCPGQEKQDTKPSLSQDRVWSVCEFVAKLLQK